MTTIEEAGRAFKEYKRLLERFQRVDGHQPRPVKFTTWKRYLREAEAAKIRFETLWNKKRGICK